MSAYRVGTLAVLVGALTLVSSGTAVEAQQQQPAAGAAVHTIKITLAPSAPSEKDCRIRPPSPQTAGVYPGDTLIWNVENGCETEATVSIGDLTLIEPKTGSALLLRKGEKWPAPINVPAKGRRDVRVRVSDDAVRDPGFVFEYPVSLKVEATAPYSVLGRIGLCRQPPCPSGEGERPVR